MRIRLAMIIAVSCVLALTGLGQAAPPFGSKWVTTYDGYLQEDGGGFVLADTLIVVNNAHGSAAMPVWIEVYDKYGTAVPVASEGQTLLNGGSALAGNAIPSNGFGWITLGMIVNRATLDPWGFAGGEKFVFKVSAGLRGMPPIIEVKQVIYSAAQEFPGEAIWQPANIKTWAETCLGGLKGPGVTKLPKKMKWGLTADEALSP